MENKISNYAKAICLYIFIMIFGMFISQYLTIIDRPSTFWIINIIGFITFYTIIMMISKKIDKKSIIIGSIYIFISIITLALHGKHLFDSTKSLGLNVNIIVVALNLGIVFLTTDKLSLSKNDLSFICKFIFYIGFIAAIYSITIEGISLKKLNNSSSQTIYNNAAHSFFDSKNSFGIYEFLAIVSGIYLLFNDNKKIFHFVILIVEAFMLYVSFSRASLLALGVFLIFYLLLILIYCDKIFNKKNKKLVLRIYLAIACILGISLVVILCNPTIKNYIFDIVLRVGVGNAGRDEIWKNGIKALQNSPLNYIFGIGWSELNANDCSYLHNIYLEIFVVGGILKSLIYLYVFIIGIKRLLNMENSIIKLICISTCVSYFAFGFYESQIIFELGITPLLFMLFIFIIPSSYKGVKINLEEEKIQVDSSKKKLVFITTRLFWPTDSGRKVSLYHYCKGLHEKYGFDIYLYSFLENDKENGMDEIPNFIKYVKLASKISAFDKIKNLIYNSLFKNWPFQNSIVYNKENEIKIKEYVDNIKPDVVMVDMIRLAPYYNSFKELNCLKILDMDDLLSKRYEGLLINKEQKGDIMGAFSKNESLVSKVLKNKILKRIVLKSEKKRVYNFEIKYGKIYDKIIFVSDRETKEFNERIGETKAYTVRLGIDYAFFNEPKNIEKKDGYLGFIGNLSYAPNIDSLEIIINKILPKLDFNYHLIVVGKCPQYIIEKYKSDSVEFKGMVDDFRVTLKECELFVSPIMFGSGVKTKILEAMALGVPVVTNSIGAEGIDAEYGKDIVVYDKIEDIVEKLNVLHANKNLALQISKSGQMLMKNKYDWNIVLDSFKEILK